jgi:hypothetical protein
MATSCKDAIKMWETAEGKVAAESEDVRLCPISLQAPVIAKMDAALSGLKKCKHLASILRYKYLMMNVQFRIWPGLQWSMQFSRAPGVVISLPVERSSVNQKRLLDSP